MNFEKLIYDFKEATGSEPKIEITDELDENCPAEVGPNGEIRIWSELPELHIEEAKAHEIYHIYLRKQGLIAFQTNDAKALFIVGSEALPSLDALAREINNAISHRQLLDDLKYKYGIQSDYHLAKRAKPIEELIDEVNAVVDDIPLLHHYGAILYDIERTFSGMEAYVDKAKGLHPEIERAYNACKSHLTGIELGQDVQLQRVICENLFTELGYQDCFEPCLNDQP